MKRRAFVAAGLAFFAAPRAVLAQGDRRVPKLGVLYMNRPVSTTGLPPSFWERMSELGWVRGQNLAVELRGGVGESKRLATLAAELMAAKVDAVAMDNGSAAKNIQSSMSPTPICVAGGDLQLAGVVKNIGRPESNITGVSGNQADLVGKRLSLLKEVVPGVTHVGVLLSDRTVPLNVALLRAAEEASRTLGIRIHVIDVHTAEDVERAFPALMKLGARALVVVNNPVLTGRVDRVQSLATRNGLAAIYEYRYWAAAGGLMSYGGSTEEIYRQLAECVDKVLRGGTPADIPVQQPRRFELVINMKTAKALGLTIPRSLRLLADEVIE